MTPLHSVNISSAVTVFHDLIVPTILFITVLKMCRNKQTRKFIVPKSSIFDPRGIYVLKTADQKDELFSNNKNGRIRCHSTDYEECTTQRGLGSLYPLYLWRGKKGRDFMKMWRTLKIEIWLTEMTAMWIELLFLATHIHHRRAVIFLRYTSSLLTFSLSTLDLTSPSLQRYRQPVIARGLHYCPRSRWKTSWSVYLSNTHWSCPHGRRALRIPREHISRRNVL